LPPRFLIELPADEPERARQFWQGLLETTLVVRVVERANHGSDDAKRQTR
jgi:hypothetical protein